MILISCLNVHVSVHHVCVFVVHVPIYLDSDIYLKLGEVNGEGEKRRNIYRIAKRIQDI